MPGRLVSIAVIVTQVISPLWARAVIAVGTAPWHSTPDGGGPLAEVTPLPSVQGEQQPASGWERATPHDVDTYVDRVSDEVLECRQNGRHRWPALRVQDQPFHSVDETGLFVRRILCQCCELAVRIEKWEASGRGRRARLERVSSHVEYLTGSSGETYLAPSGRGRMTPRQVADSVASKAVQQQSLAALRKKLPRSGART